MERNRERPINHTTGLVELARTEAAASWKPDCSPSTLQSLFGLGGGHRPSLRALEHGHSRDDADTPLMNLGGPGDGDGRGESAEQ